MINAKDFKTHLEMMITEIEENTIKWSVQTRSLFNNLIAAKRACERIIKDQEIINKQGQEYFEHNMPAEKKPIKIQKPKK